MIDVTFSRGELAESEQATVTQGFADHSQETQAPEYRKELMKWLAVDEKGDLKGALTANVLWDWMYVDELWVHADLRGQGLGKRLMELAEDFARDQRLQGIWLWTQSWQAKGFYTHLGYEEFARFENCPQGHTRIGFRKRLV